MGLDRIEADEPLERTAAGSIPKPCLEAGHRIVPTCPLVHVGWDRTDRSSVLLLDCTPSTDRIPAEGLNPWYSRLTSGHHLTGLLGELLAKLLKAAVWRRAGADRRHAGACEILILLDHGDEALAHLVIGTKP